MAADIFRAQQAQVWMYNDGVDKTKIDSDDYVLKGKRPVLILRAVGETCTIIPFTTKARRYMHIERSCNIIDNDITYAAIDMIKTISASELTEYIGQLKNATFDNTVKLVANYIEGDIIYDREKDGLIYRSSKALHNNEISNLGLRDGNIMHTNLETNSTTKTTVITETRSESNLSQISRKDYSKFGYADKLYILTGDIDILTKRYKLDRPDIYYLRKKYKNELDLKTKPIESFTDTDKEFLLKTDDYEKLQNYYHVNKLTIDYLKHIFASK